MYQTLFCMPYKSDWSQDVWDTLNRQITEQDTTKLLRLYRVDTSKFSADVLAEKIEEELKGADVIVFDVTEVNPNVHIEIGFALALAKPVILITQDLKYVTTHLQGRIIKEYSHDIDSLTRLSTELLYIIKDKIKLIKAEEKRSEAEMGLAVQYDVECYSNRDFIGLEKYFRAARRRIDILTTNLAFLFDAHETEFEKKSSSPRTYFDEIKTALDRETSKLKVRVLTLDPESDFAAKRGKQLGFSAAVFRDDLRKALADTRKIAEKYPHERFELRSYEDFPNQISFRIDDDIFNCVVAQPTQSRNHLAFKLDRRLVGVENSFINHFQNVWGNALKT